MSRDRLGGGPSSPWRRPADDLPAAGVGVPVPAPSGGPPPGAAPGPSADVVDDLDGSADGTATAGGDDGTVGPGAPGTSSGGAPRRRPRRPGRRAVALLVVGALVGTAGTLLSVRAREAGQVALASGGAYPGGLVPGGGDDGEDLLQALVLLVNTGGEDVEVVGGGTGRAARLEGEVSPADAGTGGADPGAAPAVVVPAAGSSYVLLTVTGSCDDPPAWEPWVRVRTAGGTTPVVDLATVTAGTQVGGVLPDPLADACSTSYVASTTPSVVRSRSEDGGLLVDVHNGTDVEYVVAVDDPGPLGVSVADDGGTVTVPPGRTVPVALRVDPADCTAAVAVEQPALSVGLVARRTGEGEGPRTATLDLDPFTAGGRLGVAVGRACPDVGGGGS